ARRAGRRRSRRPRRAAVRRRRDRDRRARARRRSAPAALRSSAPRTRRGGGRMSAVRAGLGRLGVAAPVAAVVLLGILVAVAAPGLLAPGDPLAVSPAEGFRPPSLAHPFGTDESGRDVLTRVIHGAAASAGIGLAATAIGVGLGLVLGFASGLGPRVVDAALSRIIEVLYALPTLVMALLFVAVLGPGPRSSILAIGLATAPGYARMIRARVRQVMRSDYVAYARHEETSAPRILVRHIVPNTVWP